MNDKEMLELLVDTSDGTKDLTNEMTLVTNWKLDGVALVKVIKAMKAKHLINEMPFKTFLTYCTACGGDWLGMLLTGIHDLYPIIWELIPNDMGVYALTTIMCLLELLEIDISKK